MAFKDIEKERKYKEKWRRKKYASNPEFRAKEKKRNREYRDKNKDEISRKNQRQSTRRRAETPWLLHWYAARARCNNPKNKRFKHYGGKGIRMLLTKLEIEILYKCGYAGQMNKLSIDRINSNGSYIFDNCRFIELSENVGRANRERTKRH